VNYWTAKKNLCSGAIIYKKAMLTLTVLRLILNTVMPAGGQLGLLMLGSVV